jgi:hypothetical protein
MILFIIREVRIRLIIEIECRINVDILRFIKPN